MRKIAVIEAKEREALFRNTAARMGISEAVIEKDFWVCYMLDYLFHRCAWKDNLAFKGGTSLSKAYDLIKRFSEDIDLILDWRVLGYGIDEPWEQRSNTKQDAFNKEANERAEVFLRDVFLPAIKNDLTEELTLPVKCEIDSHDGQTVKFTYPNSFSDTAILQEIRLEIGALRFFQAGDICRICPLNSLGKRFVKICLEDGRHDFPVPSSSFCAI